MATPQPAPPSRSLVVATVGFYMVAGIVMVTANKWVLTTTAIPIFFLFVQLVIAVLLLLVSHAVGVFVIPGFDLGVAKSLWKLILVNVMGLSLNNLCLQYVDASFYQIARGLVLPFTVILTFILQSSPPSRMALGSCAIVTAGFLIGVGWNNFGSGPGGVSGLGVFFGLASSVTTAVHAIVIKNSLPIVDGSAMDLAWYSNAMTACIMLPLSIVVGEAPKIMEMWDGELDDGHGLRRFIWGGAVTGVFGFLICIAGFLSIKVTSPVSHMISSAMRSVIQTVIGVWMFHDIITSSRAASILTIAVGSCHYVWAKHREQQPQPPAYEPIDMEEIEEGKGRDSNEQSRA